MPLHNSKRTALLNSLNCITSNDLTSLKDLSDGKCLTDILTNTFNEPSDDTEKLKTTSKNDKSGTKSDKIENAGNSGLISDENSALEYIDVCMIESENENCIQDSVLESVESLDAVDKVILKRYNFIKNFINEKYCLKSEEIIEYSKCIHGNEFELSKVAIFILSEVVRHFVNINNDNLRTLAHLDVRVQEDLEECFHLFIFDRESISKKVVERILSNHAKYKCRSPKSPFATPRRNCMSKYRFDYSSTPTNEEVYSNSPLKSFFESPVFKKEDILVKEKEIAKTRNNLHEEEIKSEELQFELNNARKEIEERDREIKALKAALKEQESDKNLLYSVNFEDELKLLQEKYESLERESSHKCIEYEKEIAELMKQNQFLEFEAKKSQTFARYQTLNEQDLLYELSHKDMLLGKKNEVVTNYRLKQSTSFTEFDRLQSMLDSINEELAAEKERSKALEIQAAKERELYAEKLAELKQVIKKEPESPSIGENLGVIIEEENRILQLELDNANLKIKQLQKKLKDIEEFQQNNVPDNKKVFNRSIVETMDLAETPKCKKRRSLKGHTSTLEVLDLPETSGLKKRLSEKGKELNDLPVVCDTLSNSEIVFRNSPSSLHSEEVPFVENLSEPVLEEIGALWKNMEDSHLEIENIDSTACISELNTPENCDRLLNKSMSLCSLSKCNVSNKNGFKFSTTHFEKSRNVLQELKKKDEEIDNLKATCEILQVQCEDYVEKIKENNKTIEDLKTKLSQMKTTCEARIEKYKNLLCYKEKADKFDLLVEKYKQIKISLHRCEEKYRHEIKDLKINKKKREQENMHLREEIQILNLVKVDLNKKNKQLETHNRELKEKLNEAEKKLKQITTANQKEESKNIGQTVAGVNSKNVEQSSNYKKEAYFIPLDTEVSKDVNNESTLSGALYRKSGLPLDSFLANGEDEDSFFDITSLTCPSKQKNRFEELIRRNSILPYHLQSSYPVEMNLTPSTKKFYLNNKTELQCVKGTETVDNVNLNKRNETEESGYHNKKRKNEELDDESFKVASCSTPLFTKRLKIFRSPSNRSRFFNKISQRNAIIKPKP